MLRISRVLRINNHFLKPRGGIRFLCADAPDIKLCTPTQRKYALYYLDKNKDDYSPEFSKDIKKLTERLDTYEPSRNHIMIPSAITIGFTTFIELFATAKLYLERLLLPYDYHTNPYHDIVPIEYQYVPFSVKVLIFYILYLNECKIYYFFDKERAINESILNCLIELNRKYKESKEKEFISSIERNLKKELDII